MVTRTYLPTYLWDSNDSCDSCGSSDSIDSSDSSDIIDSSDGSNSSDSSDNKNYVTTFFFQKKFISKLENLNCDKTKKTKFWQN